MNVPTKDIDAIYLTKAAFDDLVAAEQDKRIDDSIRLLKNKFDKIYEKRDFIVIKGKKLIYNKDYNIVIADTRKYECPSDRYDYSIFTEQGITNGRSLTESEAKTLFYDKKAINPLIEDNEIKTVGKNFLFIRISEGKKWIGISDGTFDTNTDDKDLHVPVASCENINRFELFLKNCWIPRGFSASEENTLKELHEYYKKKYISFKGDEIDFEKFKEKIKENEIDEINSVKLKRDDIAEFIRTQTIDITGKTKEKILEHLLNCDYRRAEIEPYDIKILEDPNRGHWDLWREEGGDGLIKVTVSEKLFGRDPRADIRHDGVVGIDFGTKSTVVVYQNGDACTLPVRVGRGKYKKEAKKSDYENPTVMEFRNIENFMKCYSEKEGRPETLYSDITVSHKAFEQLKESKDSDSFYTFFSDLKQWSGEKNRMMRIKDNNGCEYVLPPYLELDDGEFDPIEIYAYYLGLYINNMHRGIYIKYLLSFPVTYENAVKNKILRSFERGIKKSLPEDILDDEDVMKEFSIKLGTSEPAAYAICALQSFGLEPNGDERIYYAIFDFGGGTTDFDFGIWKNYSGKKKRRFHYTIERFGEGGDRYLGGENLLELLAFEVFKANKKTLTENSITFHKPPYCKEFPGSEALLSDSQEARLNTKQLMEKLRCVWENNDEDAETNRMIDEGKIKLMLFDNKGDTQVNFELDVNRDELNRLLRDRIEVGVRNFFDAVKHNFSRKDIGTVNGVNIFLAGNSSKSPIVKELFDKYIAEKTEEMTTQMEVSGGDKFFVVYPPLGTEEAKAIQEEMGVSLPDDELIIPTGKTGVAYGLIAGRPGSDIEVISDVKADEEVKFKYYLGMPDRKNCFDCIIARDKPYGEWVEFIDASEEEFEVYYTSLPEAIGDMPLPIKNISRKLCRIDETDEDASIYIRLVTPNEAEYVAATEEGIASEKYIGEIKKIVFE